jgi:hypothetical protein
MDEKSDEVSGPEAKLRYGDADFTVQRRGSHVTCAVTGRKVPLGSLRYWSVTRQEPYADAYAADEAYRAAMKRNEGF